MASETIKLERERRKTKREERLWQLLDNPAVVDQLAMLGGMGAVYAAGKARLINRDLGGFMFAMSCVLSAARAGVHDKYALAVIWTSAVAAYAVAVPARENEAVFQLDLSTPLGSDDKLFGLPKAIATGIFPPVGAWYAYEEIREHTQ